MLLNLWNVLWRRTAQTTSADSVSTATSTTSVRDAAGQIISHPSLSALLSVTSQTSPASVLTATATAHATSVTSPYDVSTETAVTVSNTIVSAPPNTSQVSSTVSDTNAKGNN